MGKYIISKTSETNNSGVKAAEILNIDAKIVSPSKPMDKKAAEEFVQQLSSIKNLNDGRIVEIPVNTIGKILRHKGYDISTIIKSLPFLYETSLLGWSEPEIQREGHKSHPNIKTYHHYINKFTDDMSNYYIRFTLKQDKSKLLKNGKNIIHSVAISYIKLYEKGDGLQRIRVIDPGEANSSPFIDLRLIEFLNNVKY